MLNRFGYDLIQMRQRFDLYFKGPLTPREEAVTTVLFKVLDENREQMKREIEDALNSLRHR